MNFWSQYKIFKVILFSSNSNQEKKKFCEKEFSLWQLNFGMTFQMIFGVIINASSFILKSAFNCFLFFFFVHQFLFNCFLCLFCSSVLIYLLYRILFIHLLLIWSFIILFILYFKCHILLSATARHKQVLFNVIKLLSKSYKQCSIML